MQLRIENIPCLCLGDNRERAILFVHGKMGRKEEAIPFYKTLDGKVSVVSLDLPADDLTPWTAAPQIWKVYEWMKPRYSHISLRAASIGAYFSMLALQDAPIEKALFVSPVTDMEMLIQNMMLWANVTEDRLREKKEIPTDFGETLSWEYYTWVKSHPISWQTDTEILYGSADNLISRDMIDAFIQSKHRHLTVMEGGEHWFHTEDQLAFMSKWEKAKTVEKF